MQRGAAESLPMAFATRPCLEVRRGFASRQAQDTPSRTSRLSSMCSPDCDPAGNHPRVVPRRTEGKLRDG